MKENTLNDARQNKNPAFYTKGEEIFNAVSHIVGGGIGVIALAVLTYFALPNAAAAVAVIIFALSVILLYTMSALYHFLRAGTGKRVFRIFDHCTIFVLIAGTYTPYCLIALGGTRVGTAILVAEWVCAALGITGNAIAMNNKAIKTLSMIFYFVMGWLILVSFPVLIESLPFASFWLLLAGGVMYTLGIVFFALTKRVKYFHSIWHLFNISGTVLHFISILLMLV